MSSADNPYETPRAPITVATDSTDPTILPLASRWHRFAAWFIDTLVLYPVNLLVAFFMYPEPTDSERVEAIQKYGEFGSLKHLMPPVGTVILGELLIVAALVAINYVFLKKGQTIGKLALKLQVRNRNDSSLLSVHELVVKRILPIHFVGVLGMTVEPGIWLLLLVDALCIFRGGRNTLHDDLANTKVVKLH
jgi:uncharacterized RDD family membrane protein YckC